MIQSQNTSAERLITFSVLTTLVLVSMVLMLSCTSPELSWDEADYAANTFRSWRFLWARGDYARHGHGPLSIYLAKLGKEVLPVVLGSVELRLRLFIAMVGSLSIGFLYWALRNWFKTSQAAAIVGSSLLLFCVIRVEETNIIGPHHLMLACTIGVICLGYRTLQRPSLTAAVALGVILAFGAVSMTYVLATALCWILAVSLIGKGWVEWNRSYLQVAWVVLLVPLTALICMLALWPPGVIRHIFLSDFRMLLHIGSHPTLVGERILEVTPRSAAIYWLRTLDAPIFGASTIIILTALYRAGREQFTIKHAYLVVCLAFFLAVALSVYLAGARNLLQFVVCCA